MAPMAAQSHHHRSTTKKDKKGFKSRHATKGALKEQSKGQFPTTTTAPNSADWIMQARSTPSLSNSAAAKPPTSRS
jgi:hypothetical protein